MRRVPPATALTSLQASGGAGTVSEALLVRMPLDTSASSAAPPQSKAQPGWLPGRLRRIAAPVVATVRRYRGPSGAAPPPALPWRLPLTTRLWCDNLSSRGCWSGAARPCVLMVKRGALMLTCRPAATVTMLHEAWGATLRASAEEGFPEADLQGSCSSAPRAKVSLACLWWKQGPDC